MNNQPITSQAYFRSLTILHTSMIVGQLLMAAVIYFVFNSNKETVFGVEATGQKWIYIAGGITILSVLVSAQLFGMRLQKLRALNDLPQKMTGYRAVSILRYALLDVPSLFALILYMQTNNLLLLIFSGLILLLLLGYRPSKERLTTDLALSPAEKAIVDNPNAMVTN